MNRVNRFLPRASIAVLGMCLALVVAEGVLRRWTPVKVQGFATERFLPVGGVEEGNDVFTVDAELGYRPVLGSGAYGLHGATHNSYGTSKTAGKRRLLFLGDSVTNRGMIQAGLEHLLGEGEFEFWNAGVEGYATTQEVGYYRRYLTALRADHVILVFHLNDFQSTPVTFRDGQRLVMVYAKQSTRTLNPWLLQHSFLYRWYLSLGFDSAALAPNAIPTGVYGEIESALIELRDLVQAQSGRLTVLVFPWLRPLTKWPGSYAGKRAWILATLDRLGVAHYDFLPSLEAALADGEQVTEKERDPQHPSADFGRRIARDLLAAGFVP